MVIKSRNGQLHLAIVVALVAASLLAIAVPITRSHASARSSQPTAAGAAGDGLTLALQSQALAVAGALSQPGTANAAPAEYARQLQTLPAHDLLPQELLTAVSRAAAGGVLDSGHPGTRAVAQPPVPFTVHTSGLTVTQTSSKTTVGEALREIGVQVDEHDAVRPPQDARLTPGLNIYVSYATTVYLTLEGKERLLQTQADTVGGVLSEQGLTLEPADRIYPAVEQPVQRGMSINVVTVRENVEFTDDPIAYDRLYEYDSSRPKGEVTVLQAGAAGYVRHEYRIKRFNGQEVGRQLLSETVIQPTMEIMSVGTLNPAAPAPAAVAAPVPAPAAVLGPESPDCATTMTVYATWYSAASAGGSGVTATGTGVYKGIVAVDPSVIPLGTRMYVPGYGYGVAADTGGAIRGYHIDLGYGADDVKDWSTRNVDICILN